MERGDHDRLVDADPEPLTSNMRVSTAMILDVVDRPGDPFVAMRRLLTDNHEPRKRQLQHIREAVGIARSLLQAGVLERLDRARARRTALPTDRRPAARLRPQPAAVDVRARRGRRARPGVGNLCAGRGFGHRGDPGGPAPDPGRAAEQGQGRGRGRDEGRGHRVRRADGAARRRHLSQAARGAARARLRGRTCRATRGPPTRSCRRSPSCARCGSGRSPSGSSSASTG